MRSKELPAGCRDSKHHNLVPKANFLCGGDVYVCETCIALNPSNQINLRLFDAKKYHDYHRRKGGLQNRPTTRWTMLHTLGLGPTIHPQGPSRYKPLNPPPAHRQLKTLIISMNRNLVLFQSQA